MPDFDRAAAEQQLAERFPLPSLLAGHLRAALVELDREKARKIPTYAADLELTLEVIAEALGGAPEATGLVSRVERLVADRDRLAAENAALASEVRTLRANLETCSGYAEAEIARLTAENREAHAHLTGRGEMAYCMVQTGPETELGKAAAQANLDRDRLAAERDQEKARADGMEAARFMLADDLVALADGKDVKTMLAEAVRVKMASLAAERDRLRAATEENARLRGRVAELERLAGPFALQAEIVDNGNDSPPPDTDPMKGYTGSPWPTIGDCRRLAAAVRGERPC